MFEVEVASLFDQALQFHRTAPIALLFTERGDGLLNRFPVLPGRFFLGFRQDHTLLKQRQDEGKVFFASGLPTQDAPCLLGFAAPLPVSVKSRRAHHGRDLFVGVLRLPLAEFVQPIPERHHGRIDDRTTRAKQTQRICLHPIGQADGIAEGLCSMFSAHSSKAFCLRGETRDEKSYERSACLISLP